VTRERVILFRAVEAKRWGDHALSCLVLPSDAHGDLGS